MIHKVFVEVIHLLATLCFQIFDTAHNFNVFALIAAPNRERSPPKTIPADGPISGIEEPVVEALFTDVTRDPVGLFVVVDHCFADGTDFDKPGADGFVDQGGSRTPTEGVVVINCFLSEEAPGVFEIRNDGLVRIFDELAGT